VQLYSYGALRPCRNYSTLSIVSHSGNGATREVQNLLNSLSSVVSDDAVPEGHKGLHGLLYADGAAEEHRGEQYVFRQVRSAQKTIRKLV
jgi:hypothetical protein